MMHRIFAYCFFYCVLFLANNAHAAPLITSFIPRSQSREKDIYIVGMADHTHIYDMESWYGTFSITPEYSRSFKAHEIARSLFGPFLTDTQACTGTSLLIQGSNVFPANRNIAALVADNFYLPADFDSVVSVRPHISNIATHFDFYFGLDEWVTGLYIRIYGPFVHTTWNLQLEEKINNAGTATYPAGLFTAAPLPADALLSSFMAYARGAQAHATGSDGTSPDTTFRRLNFAQMLPCSLSENKWGDIRAEIGLDALSCDDYHAGFNLQVAFPNGHVHKTNILFAPRIGDGKWEFGAGLTGHYTLWRSSCNDSAFGLYTDINITHLFAREEQRTFDLKNKPLSRYLLATKFETNKDNLSGLVNGTNVVAQQQFAYEFSPVANLTHRCINSSFGVQADMVFWANTFYDGFSIDIGYNLWIRSREHVTLRNTKQTSLPENTWGLKGNTQVIGFAEGNSGANPLVTQNQAVGLSATQNQATINRIITNRDATAPPILVNIGIDSPAQAFAGGTPSVALTAAPGQTTADSIINTSVPSIFIQEGDIDISGIPRTISNKFFAHVQYTFDRPCLVPYLGIGFSTELGVQRHNSSLLTAEGNQVAPCKNPSCALWQWSVWVKGGVSFN